MSAGRGSSISHSVSLQDCSGEWLATCLQGHCNTEAVKSLLSQVFVLHSLCYFDTGNLTLQRNCSAHFGTVTRCSFCFVLICECDRGTRHMTFPPVTGLQQACAKTAAQRHQTCKPQRMDHITITAADECCFRNQMLKTYNPPTDFYQFHSFIRG